MGITFPVQQAQKPAIRDREPWLSARAVPPEDTGGGLWIWSFSGEVQKVEDGSPDTVWSRYLDESQMIEDGPSVIVAEPMDSSLAVTAAGEGAPLYPQRNVKRNDSRGGDAQSRK